MTLDTTKVRVAGAGEVLVGATTATAPTGTAGSTTGFTGLGYLSDDGITESRNRDTNDITAFQNGSIVRTVVTSAALTFNFTMIETKKETVELYYGTTVTSTSTEGSFVIVPANTGGRKAFVIDIVDGAEITRYYIPQGEVTETGDKANTNGDPVPYEVTISAYPDSGIGGNAKVWSTSLKTSA